MSATYQEQCAAGGVQDPTIAKIRSNPRQAADCLSEDGQARDDLSIGIIEPGGRTPLHEHPVPIYVYVLEGEVELQSHGGQPHQYKAGEAYIEALNHQHQLFNKGSVPAKVLVVFVGEEGKPTTITAK
jgi:quercetin dioxygenase-like cupin family protein